jgi:hypothetical protein
MAQSRDTGQSNSEPWRGDGTGAQSFDDLSVVASRMRSASSLALNGSLKITSSYWPIAIDPEGFTVRDHYFAVNHAG